MKNPVYILLVAVLFSCSPHEQYHHTHYNIQAELDPGSKLFSANLQIVLVARQEYRDSICFSLNPDLNIHALAAQELEHYLFRVSDSSRLVLYLEDPVSPGDELLISMSYSGHLPGNGITLLDPSTGWYPVNEDSHPCTYLIKLALPGSWKVSNPAAGTGEHGKWLIQSQDPEEAIRILLTPR